MRVRLDVSWSSAGWRRRGSGRIRYPGGRRAVDGVRHAAGAVRARTMRDASSSRRTAARVRQSRRAEARKGARHLGHRPAGKVVLDVGASTAASPICYCSAARRASMPWTSATANCTTGCATIRASSSMERTNVRYLTELPEPPDLAVVDVSFISLRLACRPCSHWSTGAPSWR